MDTKAAKKMFEEAKQFYEQHCPGAMEWANNFNPEAFKNLTPAGFFEAYWRAVHANGTQWAVPQLPDMTGMFKNFETMAQANMQSFTAAMSAFNQNEQGQSFLDGYKAIAEEGFAEFKKRLEASGISELENMPGIGPATKFYFAKDIGLDDAIKPDVWLARAAELCKATIDEMADFLSKEYNMRRGAIDAILHWYGAEKSFGK